MQAPQLRLNERQANPNPYIIFIRSLQNKKDHTDAEDILKAVAAQMRTIMRERFMQVHTLEEAAFNRVFAGRNWNHGQSIELVLRGPSGRFLPMPYIISVMCHEMAHIEQMNHGPKFQKLMADIKADVGRLQSSGYYGDGFWSDGKRLKDSVRMGGEGYRASDFPEYVCGVSASDARKAKRPSRGPGSSRQPGLVKGEASHRSGRQTEYRRKAGRKNNADMGEGGSRLDGGRQITKEDREQRRSYIDDMTQVLLDQGLSMTKAKKRAGEMWEEDNPWWKEGSTRGKVAKSKTAAEMRAAAAEARLRALAGPATSTDAKPLTTMSDDEGEEKEEEEDVKPVFDEEDEVDDPHIGIEERKKEMEDEMDESEREGLRGGWEEYINPPRTMNAGQSSRGVKRERSPTLTVDREDTSSKQPKSIPGFGAAAIRQERLKALGIAPILISSEGRNKGRKLGSTPDGTISLGSKNDRKSDVSISHQLRSNNDGVGDWECKVCTFINMADHGRCEMCQARPDGAMPDDVII
ncbi:hypothetical protein I203_106623 [Kwoniella mangroviensis CBS 8507]|uniref:uncharacterized protein n=1 Tax=Kwoniella mangroviensis CBS 8507 TaxID=1296122 RepID=UPI00080D5F8F|nr:uncharacterized protein I203_06879 [Kwoniella mangroviensis CBS 8507]OCF63923.1 hypothetical protein I203_06879 [Kwoniella mangroviensis CBS 8507]